MHQPISILLLHSHTLRCPNYSACVCEFQWKWWFKIHQNKLQTDLNVLLWNKRQEVHIENSAGVFQVFLDVSSRLPTLRFWYFPTCNNRSSERHNAVLWTPVLASMFNITRLGSHLFALKNSLIFPVFLSFSLRPLSVNLMYMLQMKLCQTNNCVESKGRIAIFPNVRNVKLIYKIMCRKLFL